MKAGEFIDAIERFFLDLIGQVIPGGCLLLGASLIWTAGDWSALASLVSVFGSAKWALAITMSYVAGHGVTSMGDTVIVPVTDALIGLLEFVKLRFAIPPAFQRKAKMLQKIESDSVFKAFKCEAVKFLPALTQADGKSMVFSAWRNVAMSVASTERNTVWRFMFISLLNQGIATVLILLVILQIALAGLAPSSLGNFPLPIWVFWLAVLLAIIFFLERRYVFFRIAMDIPFGMALVELRKTTLNRENESRQKTPDGAPEGPRVIYLAGGFQSGWQDELLANVKGFRFYDPRVHRLGNGDQYTIWDLEAIRRSDWVFACLEASNPGGYSLALEVGYAKALGKRVILLNEKESDPTGGRYLGMLNAAADVKVASLDEGIAFLLQLQAL
jgi:nucleoside 2-deoxyribosyltransferase